MKINRILIPLFLLLCATEESQTVSGSSPDLPEQRQPNIQNTIVQKTAAQRPVYFFVGPAGAGKSTAIFALQKNEVNKKAKGKKEESKYDNSAEKDVENTSLAFKKNVKGLTPPMGDSDLEKTTKPMVCSLGDIAKNMAFCDTVGFEGASLDENVEKLTSAFALTANKIGGIVVVVSADEIVPNNPQYSQVDSFNMLSSNWKNFKSTIRALHKYFSDTGHSTPEKSILLMITKWRDNKKKKNVEVALRRMIHASHQLHFKTSGHDMSRTNLAALPPFLAMLLQHPVKPGEEQSIQNFQLDDKKIVFFDPCSEASINDTLTKLRALQPLGDNDIVYKIIVGTLFISVVGLLLKWLYNSRHSAAASAGDKKSEASAKANVKPNIAANTAQPQVPDTYSKSPSADTTVIPTSNSGNHPGWGFQAWLCY